MIIKTIFCRMDGTQTEREVEVSDDYFTAQAVSAAADADTAADTTAAADTAAAGC